MTYPDDRTMTTLAVLCVALDFEIWDDDAMVAVTATDSWEVYESEVDALTERGWIEHGEGSLAVTESGRYWSDRYQKTRRVRT